MDIWTAINFVWFIFVFLFDFILRARQIGLLHMLFYLIYTLFNKTYFDIII